MNVAGCNRKSSRNQFMITLQIFSGNFQDAQGEFPQIEIV